MGWTTMRKPEDVSEWFRKTLTWENADRKSRVLDSAIVNRSVGYAAVELTTPSGHREVWAAVFLFKFYPNDQDGYTFGYKDMEETMGPYEASCPKRILDLLTPTDNKNANEWREKCRARLARREENRFKAGDVVRFDTEIGFTDGAKGSLFRLKPYNRKIVFEMLDDAGQAVGIYRIRGWRDRTIERVSPEDVEAMRNAGAGPRV